MGHALAFIKQGVDYSSKLNFKFNQHQICDFTANFEIFYMFTCVVWHFRSLDTSPLKKILLLPRWMKTIWFSLFLENSELSFQVIFLISFPNQYGF